MERGLIFKVVFAVLLCYSTVEGTAPTTKVKEAVAPYLLTDEHPIKPALDALFSSSRVTLNLDTLQEAGFKKSKPRKFSKLVVTTNPAFPGYIFKIYMDAQRPVKKEPEHYYWLLRIEGAEKIRKEIKKRGLESLFAVPKKWIYELPKHPVPPSGYYQKYYILVEEDMNILSNKENNARWASDAVSPKLVRSLFQIVKTLGLSDCVKSDNIPFTKEGRVAFIDTQSHGHSVYYRNFTFYLSKENRKYWKSLLKRNLSEKNE